MLPALFVVLSAQLSAPAVRAQGSRGSASSAEVREMGRLERADMVPVILPFLASDAADVRAEAANALAQSLWPLVRAAPGERADSTVAVVATA
ncbi:MAG TPA: hypothetical protein VIR34_16130, partial [Gemmatimonadaceae bacterium]